MKYAFHYTRCTTSCAPGHGLWLVLAKLAAFLGAGAGVVWALRAAGRAVGAAATSVGDAAVAAGPAALLLALIAAASFAVALVAAIVRNNQRPPLIPNERPVPTALAASTVEVVAVTRTHEPRALPRPRPQVLVPPAPAPVEPVHAMR